MRARRICFAVLLLATASSLGSLAVRRAGPAPSASAAAETSPPRVRLVATGGTISSRAGVRLTADDLLGLIPSVERFARPEAEQFSNTTSSDLTLAQWLDLARRLDTLLRADDGLAGIVVTTGTDTLEETAYFLNLTVRSDRPVVVVGAMRSPGSFDDDGPANLLAGFRVAADRESRDRGVLVVLNGEIHAARDVTKTGAVRLDAFQSASGPLGAVERDRIVYHQRMTKRHTASSEFDISRVQDLPRVDIVLVYQGASGGVIRALVDQGARGIVVAAAGAGSTSGTQAEGMRYATGRGVFVVLTTRNGSRVARVDAGDRAADDGGPRRQARIAGEDLAPLKARVLLMLALTATDDGTEIQRMFREY